MSDKDIGKPRDEVSIAKLRELNPYVSVAIHHGELGVNGLKKFQVVVLADQSLDSQLNLNNICHENGIAFVSVETRGVFGNLFCDFGKEFICSDTNGEQPQSLLIANISQVFSICLLILLGKSWSCSSS